MENFDTVVYHDKYSDCETMLETKEKVCIAILGKIPCGYPKFLDDDIEGYLEIPYSMIGPGEFFVLRADGDSMVNAGILDNDLVLIKKQNYADDGQIVVALNNGGVTLKRIHYDIQKEKYYLAPENDDYPNIIWDEIEILGIAVKVVKNL